MPTLRSKELNIKLNNKTMFINGNRNAFIARGRRERKKQKNTRHQSSSKSKGKKSLRYFIYHKEGHFKCDFLEKIRYKEKYKESFNAEASIAQDGYDNKKTFTILEEYY